MSDASTGDSGRRRVRGGGAQARESCSLAHKKESGVGARDAKEFVNRRLMNHSSRLPPSASPNPVMTTWYWRSVGVRRRTRRRQRGRAAPRMDNRDGEYPAPASESHVYQLCCSRPLSILSCGSAMSRARPRSASLCDRASCSHGHPRRAPATFSQRSPTASRAPSSFSPSRPSLLLSQLPRRPWCWLA